MLKCVKHNLMLHCGVGHNQITESVIIMSVKVLKSLAKVTGSSVWIFFLPVNDHLWVTTSLIALAS